MCVVELTKCHIYDMARLCIVSRFCLDVVDVNKVEIRNRLNFQYNSSRLCYCHGFTVCHSLSLFYLVSSVPMVLNVLEVYLRSSKFSKKQDLEHCNSLNIISALESKISSFILVSLQCSFMFCCSVFSVFLFFCFFVLFYLWSL